MIRNLHCFSYRFFRCFLSLLFSALILFSFSSCKEENSLLAYQDEEYKFLGECNINGAVYRGVFDISKREKTGERSMSFTLSYPDTLCGITVQSVGDGSTVFCENMSISADGERGIASVFDLFSVKNPTSTEYDGDDIVSYTENGNVRASFKDGRLLCITRTNGTDIISVTVTERL